MDKISLFSELSTFYNGKKIFLTGHTGFKGTWLVKILNLFGAKVYGFSLPKNEINKFFKSTDLKLELDFEGDLANLESLKDATMNLHPDIVINMAAQAIVFESYKKPINTFNVNVMGTVNLLSIFNKFNNLKVALFITTDKVYKNDNIQRNFIETDPLGGYDPYSASKAASEIVIESWRKTMNSNRIQILTARAGNVIGGGDWSKNRLIPDIFKNFIEHKTQVEIRNPESTRPWQHVIEPLVGYLMYIKYAFNNTDNNVYSLNFGPNVNDIRSVKEVINEISKLLFIDSNQLIKIIPSNYYESKFLSLDSSLARKLINWEPRFSFSESLKLTIEWYINHQKVNNNQLLDKQILYYFN
jgi:CDP-glucose 4,6-dehydratase